LDDVVAFCTGHHDGNPPCAILLRARRERPRCRAAEQRHEFAPFHSITSSARASSVATYSSTTSARCKNVAAAVEKQASQRTATGQLEFERIVNEVGEPGTGILKNCKIVRE
jgi:hypothetical protein